MTDAAGGYTITSPLNGDYLVFDDPADGYGTEIVPISVGLTATVIDAVLVDRAISGMVDDLGGSPVEGATVRACPYLQYVDIDTCASATTASDGTYVLAGLGTGEYSIYVSATTHFGSYYGTPTHPGTLVAGSEPAPTPGIDVTLVRGATISGTVTDATGSPLAGIDVSAFSFGAGGGSATTGPDGSYTIGPFQPEYHYLQFADPTETYASVSLNVQVTEAGAVGDVTGADVTMRVAGGISGIVTDERSGAPLEGARVNAYAVDCCFSSGYATTAADGSYTVTGLDPDAAYVLLLYGPNYYGTDGAYLGTFHQNEYWNDTTDYFEATPVSISAGTTTAGYDAALALTPCDGREVTVLLAAGETPTNGNDVILGTNQAEVIDGLDGNDTICGMSGNDTITGGAGLDTISGDEGNDVIDGGPGIDTIYGGYGDDDLFGAGGSDKIYGDWGNDLVRGGTGNDYLEGGGGSDEIRGQNGSDTIYANSAADSSTTDPDVVYGGGLYESIYGDSGPDVIYGGDFADVLAGRDGDDQLYGNNGVDTLRGGAHVVGDYCNGGTRNSGSGDTATACEIVENVP